jgi:hypothetical protein
MQSPVGQPGAPRGSARRRLKAAASASAQGQSRARRSLLRRPEHTSRAAVWSRRWRRRLGSASASSPSRQSARAQANRSWRGLERSPRRHRASAPSRARRGQGRDESGAPGSPPRPRRGHRLDPLDQPAQRAAPRRRATRAPSPSAATSTVWSRDVGFTFKVSSLGRNCELWNPHSSGPGGRQPLLASGVYRRIEARRDGPPKGVGYADAR